MDRRATVCHAFDSSVRTDVVPDDGAVERRRGFGARLSYVNFVYDYGQLYVYDASLAISTDGNPYLDALDAAAAAGLTVGVASGLVDILMPRQENFGAELEVATTDSAPAIDESADHIVEFDLASSGRITLEGSGGSGEVQIEIALGHYRARLSGFDFDGAEEWSYGDPGYPPDHYRLELWPSETAAEPAELRRWAGHADRL